MHSFHGKGDVVKLAPTLVAGENLGTDAEKETGTYLCRSSVHASLPLFWWVLQLQLFFAV